MAKTPERTICNEESEAYVVASVLRDPSLLGELDLDPEDFFISDHRYLFGGILSLVEKSEEVNELTVAKETADKVGSWVISRIMADLPDDIDFLHHAEIVKELKHRRQLLAAVDTISKELRTAAISSEEAADQLQSTIQSLNWPSRTSRMVFFSNARVVGSFPPTYKITVSSHNRKQIKEIKFSSQDLDKQAVVKRKVREKLQINPVLPKNFDGFVHQLLQNAQLEEGPFDASEEANICYWIREWFKTAVEAEDPDDLTRGYLDREGAYWFVSERLNGYLSDRTKEKLTSPMLWSVINDRGGRKSKVFSLAGKKVRLWGLDKDFFEEHEPAEAEQLAMQKGDDLSFLEE